MVAMTDGSQLEAVVVVPKAAVRPVLPAALEMTPAMVRTEGVMAKGPPDTMVVTEETGRELSLVSTWGGQPPACAE